MMKMTFSTYEIDILVTSFKVCIKINDSIQLGLFESDKFQSNDIVSIRSLVIVVNFHFNHPLNFDSFYLNA